MPYADLLAGARHAAGLTQAEAAEAVSAHGLSVAVRTWETWEGGKHAPPEKKGQQVLQILRDLAKKPAAEPRAHVLGPAARAAYPDGGQRTQAVRETPEPTYHPGDLLRIRLPNGTLARVRLVIEQDGPPLDAEAEPGDLFR